MPWLTAGCTVFLKSYALFAPSLVSRVPIGSAWRMKSIGCSDNIFRIYILPLRTQSYLLYRGYRWDLATESYFFGRVFSERVHQWSSSILPRLVACFEVCGCFISNCILPQISCEALSNPACHACKSWTIFIQCVWTDVARIITIPVIETAIQANSISKIMCELSLEESTLWSVWEAFLMWPKEQESIWFV